MCPDHWWKTFSHASQIAIRPDSIQWNVRAVTRWRCEFAPCSVLFGCRAGVDLVAKDGLHRQENRQNLVFLRTRSPRLRCNQTPALQTLFCCSAIVRYVGTAYRGRPAAALRSLRGRHGQNREAAPNRIAPARLRLQVRRLQPDHLRRGGPAGGSASPLCKPDDAAAAAPVEIDGP